MKKRSKILLSAILTIALCLSLIAGSTFALFTSESKVNIAVKSGKVKVTAAVDDLKLYSAKADETGDLVDENGEKYVYELKEDDTATVADESKVFTNGGTAAYTTADGLLTLDRVTPGDRVTFTVAIGNESNVAIQYRVIVKVVSGLKLYSSLTVKLDGVKLNGVNKTGTWTYLAPDSDIADIPVEIFMPITTGNEYQDLRTEMSITVEAVQGNAKTTNDVLSTTVEAIAEGTTAVENNATTNSTTISDSDNLVTVIIPSSTALTTDDDSVTSTSLALKVKPQDTVSEITILSNKTSASYDVSVLKTTTVGGVTTVTDSDAIADDNTSKIVVEMFVGTGLTGVELYHKTDKLNAVASLNDVDELNEFYYDSASGKITFITKSFSEYTVVYNKDYAVETVNENNESVITVYKATETEGLYQDTKTGEIVSMVENTNGDVTATTMFAGGTGTESDPFLVVDYDTFQHISDLYEEGYYNFKVKDGIASIDLKNWVPVYLNGNFDGNGVVFDNLDMGLFKCADGESSTIKNFTVNANISRSGGVGVVVYDSDTLNLTIDSVNVHGTVTGASWVTPYVEFGPGPSYAWNLTIKNSVSDATLVATSGSASGFVGHPFDDVSNGSVNGSSLITIIDSAYIGNMSATGAVTGTNFKYFTINGNDNRVKTYYSDSFIEKLGFNPEGTLYKEPADAKGYAVINNEDGSKTFFAGNYGKNVVDNYKPTDKKAVLNTTAQATLPENIGDVFTVTKVSGAVKAVVSLQIAPNDQNNYGSYLGTYMSEEIDVSSVEAGSTFTSEEVRYFTININSGATSKTGVSGNIFNVVNSFYGKNAHNGAWVKIAQFDANGNVLNITSIKIASPHAAE